MKDPIELDHPKNAKVGYCKPPEHTRFKKGQSGNAQGRPKGKLNMATVLDQALREKVVINENGKRKIITKLEAGIKQLINKAASGELKALQLLVALVRSVEERGIKEATQQIELVSHEARQVEMTFVFEQPVPKPKNPEKVIEARREPERLSPPNGDEFARSTTIHSGENGQK
jgi:hypothetical protein